VELSQALVLITVRLLLLSDFVKQEGGGHQGPRVHWTHPSPGRPHGTPAGTPTGPAFGTPKRGIQDVYENPAVATAAAAAAAAPGTPGAGLGQWGVQEEHPGETPPKRVRTVSSLAGRLLRVVLPRAASCIYVRGSPPGCTMGIGCAQFADRLVDCAQ
jgi:hypothetical protein